MGLLALQPPASDPTRPRSPASPPRPRPLLAPTGLLEPGMNGMFPGPREGAQAGGDRARGRGRSPGHRPPGRQWAPRGPKEPRAPLLVYPLGQDLKTQLTRWGNPWGTSVLKKLVLDPPSAWSSAPEPPRSGSPEPFNQHWVWHQGELAQIPPPALTLAPMPCSPPRHPCHPPPPTTHTPAPGTPRWWAE